MNSFLELHTSSDYRINQREYHKSTWEYVNSASDSLPPFQWLGSSDADFAITKYDVDGNDSDITGKFFETSTLLTGWTETGGSWTVSSDSIIVSATDVDDGDYITSEPFSLTYLKAIWISIDTTKFTNLDAWELRVEKGGTPVYTLTDWSGWSGSAYYTAAATGADYTVVLLCEEDDTVVTTVIPQGLMSKTYRASAYHWYNGDTLSIGGTNFTDIFRFHIADGASDYYTDWIDPCEYTGMAKIKISSSYDYGGVKYVNGYEQYMYKRATIRRSPRAEIEITGDKLNGEIITEKKVSAVKYTMKMKCTEPEWEALVHGIGGDIEITDRDGKTYDAQNVELSDPTWYEGNGIVELAFVDGGNINVWSRNNSDL